MNPSTLPSLSPSAHPTVCHDMWSLYLKEWKLKSLTSYILHYIIQTSPTSSPTVSTINQCAYFSSSLSCASLNPYILIAAFELHRKCQLHHLLQNQQHLQRYVLNVIMVALSFQNACSLLICISFIAVASNFSSNGEKEAWSVRYTYMLSLVLEKMANNLGLLLQSTHREIQLRSQHSSRQRIQRNNLRWSQQIVQQYVFCTYDCLFFYPPHPNMLLLYFVLLVILETSNGKWNWIHILWSFLEANLIFFCSMIFTHMHSSQPKPTKRPTSQPSKRPTNRPTVCYESIWQMSCLLYPLETNQLHLFHSYLISSHPQR